MEKKLGMYCDGLPNSSIEESLKLIHDVGFSSVFTGRIDVREVCQVKNECDKLGLELETVHAPFIYINELWAPGLNYLKLYPKSLQAIDSAAEAGVKTVVHHVTGNWVPPQVTDIGLARFDNLVEYAIKKGVRIAFENIRNYGTLACLLERYEDIPEVGYCFDCGHEYCYTETVPFLDLFHKQLICTHIHDNYGRSKEDPMADTDYHFLPFDGSYDYKAMMDRFNKYNCGERVPLTLEVGRGKRYADMTDEEFVKTAYERIKKISEM